MGSHGPQSVGDTTVIPGAVDMLPLRRSSREIKTWKFSVTGIVVNFFLGGGGERCYICGWRHTNHIALPNMVHCICACAVEIKCSDLVFHWRVV